MPSRDERLKVIHDASRKVKSGSVWIRRAVDYQHPMPLVEELQAIATEEMRRVAREVRLRKALIGLTKAIHPLLLAYKHTEEGWIEEQQIEEAWGAYEEARAALSEKGKTRA